MSLPSPGRIWLYDTTSYDPPRVWTDERPDTPVAEYRLDAVSLAEARFTNDYEVPAVIYLEPCEPSPEGRQWCEYPDVWRETLPACECERRCKAPRYVRVS